MLLFIDFNSHAWLSSVDHSTSAPSHCQLCQNLPLMKFSHRLGWLCSIWCSNGIDYLAEIPWMRHYSSSCMLCHWTAAPGSPSYFAPWAWIASLILIADPAASWGWADLGLLLRARRLLWASWVSIFSLVFRPFSSSWDAFSLSSREQYQVLNLDHRLSRWVSRFWAPLLPWSWQLE